MKTKKPAAASAGRQRNIKTDHNWQDKESKELFRAVLKLKAPAEAAKFFRDLCTLEEISEMEKRWQAVQMIAKNKPYREIAKKTGLSTSTVTRVAHWLNYGEGGYRLVLSRVGKR